MVPDVVAAVFDDRLNAGSGAEAEVIVENGVVTAVNVTDGSVYIEPVLSSLKVASLFRDTRHR